MNPLRPALLEIFAELDEDIRAAAPVCEVSGRCCRFDEYGHTLFLTRPEAELLLEHGLPDGVSVEAGRCPFQAGRMCTARERRPFGCRVYFCDPQYSGVAEALTEKYLARWKQDHERGGEAWEYRPLHAFLNEFADLAKTSEEPGSDRR